MKKHPILALGFMFTLLLHFNRIDCDDLIFYTEASQKILGQGFHRVQRIELPSSSLISLQKTHPWVIICQHVPTFAFIDVNQLKTHYRLEDKYEMWKVWVSDLPNLEYPDSFSTSFDFIAIFKILQPQALEISMPIHFRYLNTSTSSNSHSESYTTVEFPYAEIFITTKSMDKIKDMNDYWKTVPKGKKQSHSIVLPVGNRDDFAYVHMILAFILWMAAVFLILKAHHNNEESKIKRAMN